MEVITGDLIELAREGRFSNIVHGCNCYTTMGAGIAKSIKQMFPRAYAADVELDLSPANRLGCISSASVEADYVGEEFRVINAYTQLHYGRGKMHVDYNAVRMCFRAISLYHCGVGTITAYPLIGCGLAGGDWNIISKIIDEEMGSNIHYLVKLK